jgi:hypothetical protein
MPLAVLQITTLFALEEKKIMAANCIQQKGKETWCCIG